MSVYLIRPKICFEAGDWYIGSTKQKLNERFRSHKQSYRYFLNGNQKQLCYSHIIFDKYGIDNCEIVLLETNIPHDNLRWRERFYLENYKTINKIKSPIITEEERKIRVRECVAKHYNQNKNQKKAYYQQNKERINKLKKFRRQLKKQNNI